MPKIILLHNQRGVAIYLTFIILTMVLASVISLNSILILQTKATRAIGDSVVAFYAADTGVEQALKAIYSVDQINSGKNNPNDYTLHPHKWNSNFAANTGFSVEIYCCKQDEQGCAFKANNIKCKVYTESGQLAVMPECLPTDTSLEEIRFCLFSTGTYKNTKRAIELKIP